VNIAAADLADSDFIPMLEKVLADAEVSPRNLGVEITESYTARQQVARNTILRLRQKGHYVAIDDFGTGYSSLAHLQQFPVDALKIDRSFISGLRENKEGETLIRTLVQLGKALEIETLAEGIEEPSELSLLRAEECDSGQGFLFARPLDADAAEAFFARWERDGAAAPPARR
jgi:EAL domain-containing protein (putative c-di-GMP-specific phosphodiesterase class I)